MTKEKYAPKHRMPPKHRAARRNPLVAVPTQALRSTVVMSSVAAAATGAVVVGGVLTGAAPTLPSLATDLSSASRPKALSADLLAERAADTVSRSQDRTAPDPAKVAALSTQAGPAAAEKQDLSDSDPRTIAKALLPEFGFEADQFGCLDSLYTSESGWRVNADNPSSSAYGIPQALPGSKMSSAGADWATNPVTQIRWGLGYIQDRYGTPCGAWSFKRGHGWY